MTVVGQEGFHTAVSYQLTAQRPGVEQLPVGVAMALHLPILADRASSRESPDHGFNQQSPSVPSDCFTKKVPKGELTLAWARSGR